MARHHANKKKEFTNLWVMGLPKNRGHKAHPMPLVHLAAAATFWNTHFQSKTYTLLTLQLWDWPKFSPQTKVWPPQHCNHANNNRQWQGEGDNEVLKPSPFLPLCFCLV